MIQENYQEAAEIRGKIPNSPLHFKKRKIRLKLAINAKTTSFLVLFDACE